MTEKSQCFHPTYSTLCCGVSISYYLVVHNTQLI